MAAPGRPSKCDPEIESLWIDIKSNDNQKVKSILEKHGIDAIQRILNELGKNVPINDALAHHTEPIDKLDADFALIKAFTRIKDSKLRRRIVDLAEEIAGQGAPH